MKKNKQKGLSGRINNIELSQLVQMVCLTGSDICITAVSKEKRGNIYIENGNIVHAETEDLQGEDALFEIAKRDNLYFQLESKYSTTEKTIDKPWEFLMLEASRLRDEESRTKKTKVLIVDDSVFFAKRLKNIIEEDEDLHVVGIATNGSEALSFIENNQVDVIIMDIFMPVMSGDTALKHIMIKYRLPVMVMSAFPEDSFSRLFDFLRLGAVDVCPKLNSHDIHLNNYEEIIKKKIKKIRHAQVENFKVLRRVKRTVKAESSRGHSQGIVVVVGAEGSYGEWFKLSSQLFSEKIVFGCTLLHHGLLSSFAKLLKEQTGYPALLLTHEHIEPLNAGTIYLVSLEKTKSIRKGSRGIELSESSSKENSFAGRVLIFIRSIIEETDFPVDVVVLSAPERCSEEWKEIAENPRIRFWLPEPHMLLCPDLVDSLMQFDTGNRFLNFKICRSWESLGKA